MSKGHEKLAIRKKSIGVKKCITCDNFMSITPHRSLEFLPGSPVLVIMLQGFKIPASSSVLCNIIL